ncbi:MAG TPA: cupin domain-containing protein [Steroidobacteraceae bacterium]|nr:cupin domain-containing protein [Steroidobacteraceae bacterium]
MSSSIVRLDGSVEPDVSEPPGERLIAGTPELRVQNFYTDTSQQFFAGRWSATRGKWRVRYSENELCVMTRGRVVIESAEGERSSFGPGDAFVVPAGFSGTWEVLEDCSKIYAIFEARS